VHDHPIITNLITKMHRLISVWAGKRSGRRWVGPIVVLGPDAEMIGPPAGGRICAVRFDVSDLNGLRGQKRGAKAACACHFGVWDVR
jgi:hypothetical protein